MLTQEQEQKIRDSVRMSLDNLRLTQAVDGGARDWVAGGDDTTQADRLAEAERIVADETERYYRDAGLVKHVSRSGRVQWLSPGEAEHKERRNGGLRRPKRRRKFDRRVVLVWLAAILGALLLAAYLIRTEAIGLIGAN